LALRIFQKKLTSGENTKIKKKIKKVIKILNETTSENPKCHLHTPNLKKTVMCRTSSFKPSLKKRLKEMDPKGTPKSLMHPIGV